MVANSLLNELTLFQRDQFLVSLATPIVDTWATCSAGPDQTQDLTLVIAAAITEPSLASPLKWICQDGLL